MSHYVECTHGFKDREALVKALVAAGFDRNLIEIHDGAVPLYGYRGDERPQKAHVVIRREHVGQPADSRAGRRRVCVVEHALLFVAQRPFRWPSAPTRRPGHRPASSAPTTGRWVAETWSPAPWVASRYNVKPM